MKIRANTSFRTDGFFGFLGIVILLAFSFPRQAVCAGLVSSVSLQNVVDALYYMDNPKYVTETAVPFSTSVSASTAGASITATYGFTNDGTNAILRIVSQSAISGESPPILERRLKKPTILVVVLRSPFPDLYTSPDMPVLISLQEMLMPPMVEVWQALYIQQKDTTMVV